MTAVVDAPCGQVAGIERPGSFAFLGIPYALPPVGDLRFQAPVRRPEFEGRFDATQYGATPQRRKFFPVTFIPEPSMPGEDTLNLNLFTPTLDSSAALPVLVYIHGGGYSTGSHNGQWFDGATFNRDGIVVVVISYRLGFDGFGWIEGAPSNRGMLDMIMALQWVQENIRAFGGDPDRVTISGQSAGGGAVLTLMCMRPAEKLFRAAISQSGVIGATTWDQHVSKGIAFAEECGVPPTVDGWQSLSEATITEEQFARADFGEPIHPVGKMLRWMEGAPCDVALTWGPTIDPSTMPRLPFEALKVSQVPLLIGSTRDEFLMPANYDTAAIRSWADDVALTQAHRTYLNEAIAQGSPDPIGRLATAAFFRELVVNIGNMRDAGTTWLYDFVHCSEGTGTASHCLELPYVWDCITEEHARLCIGENEPLELAHQLHQSWVSFVSQGNPGWKSGTCRVFGDAKDTSPYSDVASLVSSLPVSG